MKAPVFKTLSRYFFLYGHFLSLAFQEFSTYRLNALVRSIYALTYYLMMFLTLQIVTSKTPTLVGWTKPELILLFSVYGILYAFVFFLFLRGLRFLMVEGIRLGEIDKLLTKPVNFQFYVSFSQMYIEQIVLVTISFLFFVHSAYQALGFISLASLGSFLLVSLVCYFIAYLAFSTYAALAFFFPRSEQVIEVADKMADLSIYPTAIFPRFIQIGMYTIIPTAFIAYIPTLFLLGRGTWFLVGLTLATFMVFLLINRWAWRVGLRNYSSASS